MWICTTITFDAISQDCPEPIIVIINSYPSPDNSCIYLVEVEIVPPAIPFPLNGFDITIAVGGTSSLERTFCDFTLCPMLCEANAGIISLTCPTGQAMTSDDLKGSFYLEFPTTDGCLEADNFTTFDFPCVKFINESECPDPVPTEDICVQIDLIGQAINCDLPGNYPIGVISGCNASSSTASTGLDNGICFPTVDDECIQLDMTQSDCGCTEPPVTATDLFSITEFILGSNTNTVNPYSLTLADVNCSRDITALDLITIRRQILGIANDGNGSCPDVGDCVLIDESTGEIVNEFCAGDNLNLVAGVMGDFDNSCNPCGKSLYEVDVPEITLFEQEIRNDGSHLIFNQDIQFNSLALTLDISTIQNADDFTLIEFDNKNVIIDLELSGNYLYLDIFSKELLKINKGQSLLINDKSIDFTFSDLDNTFNFIYSDGAKEIGPIQLTKEKIVKDFRIISNNGNLYLMDFYPNENASIMISNISGQVIYNQEVYNGLTKHDIVLEPKNEIIFISIITEDGVITKRIFY